jgi:hypothetical protein
MKGFGLRPSIAFPMKVLWHGHTIPPCLFVILRFGDLNITRASGPGQLVLQQKSAPSLQGNADEDFRDPTYIPKQSTYRQTLPCSLAKLCHIEEPPSIILMMMVYPLIAILESYKPFTSPYEYLHIVRAQQKVKQMHK